MIVAQRRKPVPTIDLRCMQEEAPSAAPWSVWLACRDSFARERPFSGGPVPELFGTIAGAYKTWNEVSTFSRLPLRADGRATLLPLYTEPIAWIVQRTKNSPQGPRSRRYVMPNYGGPIWNAETEPVVGVFETRDDAIAFIEKDEV